ICLCCSIYSSILLELAKNSTHSHMRAFVTGKTSLRVRCTNMSHYSGILVLSVVHRFGGLHHQLLQKNNHVSPKETSTVNRHFSINDPKRVKHGTPHILVLA
ncbi:unnamed protein product, partial [Sphacelaria rigidula]